MRGLLLVLAVLGWLAGAAPAALAASPSARLPDESRDRVGAAVARYRAGDWGAAAKELAEAARTPTVIQEYILYLQADSLSRAGDAAGARGAAAQATERADTGPLVPAALLLAAREASRSGDEAAAAGLLQRFLEKYPDLPESAGARLALGQALEATGQGAEALRTYRRLWLLAPASPLADRAFERERALVAKGLVAPPLTARERVERAERLLAGGQATAAGTETEALVAEGPPADIALRALRVTAEAWRRVGRADDALKAVDRALGLAAGDRRAPWLLERARLTQGRASDRALAVLDRLLREHPRSPEAPEALLLRAEILERGRALADAEAAYQKLTVDHPDAAEAATASWRLGWLSWFRGALRDAAQRWSRLAASTAGPRLLREGAAYWAGRAHADAGEAEAAGRQWSQLVASVPRSYYGVLAAARLRSEPAGAARAAAPGALPAEPLELLQGDPGYAKVEALRAVGLGEFVAGELDAVARRVSGDPARLFAVSAAFGQDARHHLALRILRRDFVPYARSGDPSLPRLFWELYYPLGFASDLTSAAERAALDPFFVAAVVREESSYDPRARSRVGARGLMQLMPDTARPMARERGLPFQDGDLLEDPGANLEMGSAYMSRLVRDFGDPRLAVAAYNAGPRRVKEWWAARRSDDPEVFVEQIPFNETQFFVKRVMLSWDEYRRLYGRKR
jgi:soluble lytic murein transglycosylase